MRRICTVGKHPKRQRIEAALSGGQALVAVARKYDIGKSILHRHNTKQCGCYADGVVDTTPASAPHDDLELGSIVIETPQDVMNLAQRVLGRLDRLAAQAERDGDVRGAVSAIGALNKSLTDLFAKVHGLISDQPIVDQRQQNLTIAVQGGDERGIRRLLSLIADLGEERVQRLLEAIAPLAGDDVDRVVRGFVGDDQAIES
jgi:hypothetical protein